MAATEKVREVADRYQQLTHEERCEFAELIASSREDEVSDEWKAELRSRADDIDSGRVKLVDGDDFLKRLRAL